MKLSEYSVSGQPASTNTLPTYSRCFPRYAQAEVLDKMPDCVTYVQVGSNTRAQAVSMGFCQAALSIPAMCINLFPIVWICSSQFTPICAGLVFLTIYKLPTQNI